MNKKMEELADLKNFLDEKVEKFNRPFFIETDPIQVPKNFTEKENIEIAGFLTATISWGNRPAIIKNAMKLMSIMDYNPHDFILYSSASENQKLNSFIHRTFNGSDCIYFIQSLKNIYNNYDGLQAVFVKGFQKENTIKSALMHFFEIFFENTGERTRKHISNVRKNASAKRLNMFLRLIKVVV